MRALLAGAGAFPEPDESEKAQASGILQLRPLPSVETAVRTLASTLHRAGVSTGGDPLLEADQSTLLDHWRRLRQSTDGEPLILHFAGHGIRGANGGLYLCTAGADARDEFLDDTCVAFDRLLSMAENGGRLVLFLLDVCGAGQAVVQQQLQDLAACRPQDGVRNAWIIGACTNDTDTYGARFTTATATVVNRLADGALDLTPTLEYLPVDTLAAAINRELARADIAAGRHHQTIVRTPQLEAAPEPQPFLRNPAHTGDPRTALLEGMDPRLREFAHACSPGLDPLHFATRAAGNSQADVVHFSGRASALGFIQNWINNPADQSDTDDQPADGGRRLLMVTGGAGSGKSALLGVTACLTHPELAPLRRRVRNAVRGFRPALAGPVLAVHARQLSIQQITDSLHHQLHQQVSRTDDRPGWEPSGRVRTAELLQELKRAGDTLVILDALDEAIDPAQVVSELLMPLANESSQGPGPRVLLGTRRWWRTEYFFRDGYGYQLPSLYRYTREHPEAVLDLDPKTDDDRRVLADDLHTYLDLTLDTHYPPERVRDIAEQIARYTDSGVFLVATLYADHLLTSTGDDTAPPPGSITEVFELHRATLARTDFWIDPVLTVLGHARGQGMPLDLIHTAALAHQPPDRGQPTPQLTDTKRALAKAAFYLRTAPDAEQRLLYRYFHQALTDHTAPLTDPAVLYSALLATVPTAADGGRDWEHAPPYLLHHIAEHAATVGNGAVDHLLEDPSFLVHADPDILVPHLPEANTERAVLHAHIYRVAAARLPKGHATATRRFLLAWYAAKLRPSLARAIAAVPLNGRPPLALHLSTTQHNARRVPAYVHSPTGHTQWVRAVSSILLSDGTPLAITTSSDRSMIFWNLRTGAHRPVITGHSGEVNGVTGAALPDGTPVAVTASYDKTAIVWDLETGAPRHALTGHKDVVRAVSGARLADGTPVAVTASYDKTAIVWDLETGTPRHTLTGHKDVVRAVSGAQLAD
ncbi:hypothetical protein ABZ027_17145, partial [Streptomyces sp. NPDC006332]